MAEKGNLFPSDFRLHKSREFNRVREMGRKWHTPHFVVIVMFRRDGPTRLGLTVSRKVGSAVRRNRVKRLVREYFRTRYDAMPRYSDISIIAKKGASELDHATVWSELSILTGNYFLPRTSCSRKSSSDS
jgi:ribonuclease P protein component